MRKFGTLLAGLALFLVGPVRAQISISSLPSATTPLAGTEVVPIVQSGTTKKTTVSSLASTVDLTAPGPIGSVTPNTGAFTTLTSSGGALNGTLGAGAPASVAATTLSATTVSATGALTYGGVTLSNAVTGTGKMVLDTAPLLTAATTSTAPNVTAGTDVQGSLALASDYNVITTTVASPSGVTLPAATVGRQITVVNKGTNAVNVYPASGSVIDALAANAAISLPATNVMVFRASSTTQWYSSYNYLTATASGTGTVTSAAVSGGTTGLSVSGSPITTAGTITLSGTLVVANGGTGATTLTGLVKGNGAGAMTAVTAPAGTVVGTSDTQTLTAKRVSPRVVTDGASTGTLTPTGDTADQYQMLGLTGGVTIAIPSGTPTAGQHLIMRFKDNGTARALTWTTSAGGFRAIGVTLPTTTVISKNLYVGSIWNATDSFWDVIATAEE